MAIIKDEYDGQGGSYLLDPKSGKRTLIEQTKPAQPQSTEELTDGTTNTQTPAASQD